MLLAELREQSYARAGISPDNANVPADLMDRFINAALRKASTRFDPFWLETSAPLSVTAGTNEYALSLLPNFHKLSRIQAADGRVLRSLGKHELPLFLSFAAQRPQVYSVEEQKIKMAPIPAEDETLTAIYFRLEDELTDESDEPLLPDQYADWLVCEAAINAATKERDAEMLTVLRHERDDWVRNIRDDIRQQRAFPRVRTRDRLL